MIRVERVFNPAADQRGLTLVELVVVVAIVAILVVTMGFQFQGWVARYNVESATKKLYTDLIKTRTDAMARGRKFFVYLPVATPMGYEIWEDAYPPPDGDGILTGADRRAIKESRYELVFVSGTVGAGRIFGFDRKGVLVLRNNLGIIENPLTIRLYNEEGPDYDCIEVGTTRINLGVWNGTACDTK